jgi:hypothetical protein
MRSYSRHAILVAATLIHDESLEIAPNPALQEAGSSLVKGFELERDLLEARFFSREWVLSALTEQMKERNVPGRIRELSESVRKSNHEYREDLQSEFREVLRLRNEYRAICAETEPLLEKTRNDEEFENPFRNNRYRAEFRTQDTVLRNLIEMIPFLKRYSDMLKSRFYLVSREEGQRARRLLYDSGIRGLFLTVDDLPWMEGRDSTDSDQSTWWV